MCILAHMTTHQMRAAGLVIIALVSALVCGIGSAAIAQGKGLPAGGYLLLGVFLGLIGVIIAAVAQPAVVSYPPQPPGWYADPWGAAALRWWDGTGWGWQTA